MRAVKGFTLLEIMLVLALMGFLFSTITLPEIGEDPYDKVEQEAKKVSTLIDMLSEYAVLNNAITGFVVKDNQYGFMFYDGDKWLEIVEPPFSRVELDENLLIELKLDGLEWQEQNMLSSVEWIEEEKLEELSKDAEPDQFVFPQIFILPSGELSPFELDISYNDGFDIEILFRVRGEFITPVTLLSPTELEAL
jgi:general secretion pathway protein H